MVKYATGGRVDNNYDDMLHLFGGCCGAGYLLPDSLVQAYKNIALLSELNKFIVELDRSDEDVVE